MKDDGNDWGGKFPDAPMNTRKIVINGKDYPDPAFDEAADFWLGDGGEEEGGAGPVVVVMLLLAGVCGIALLVWLAASFVFHS